MMFLKKSINILVLQLVVGGLLFPSAAFGAENLDRVVGKVNDEIITLSEVKDKARANVFRMRSLGMDIPSKKKMLSDTLDKIIDEKIQIQLGHKLRLPVDEEKVLKAVDEIKEKNQIDDKRLDRMLFQEGMTLEQYKENIRNRILISKVVNYLVLNRAKVGEKDVQDYYFKNQKTFWTPGKVHASHILFILDKDIPEKQARLKKHKARIALRKIRAGAKFDKIAGKYSEDVSASTGGDLGVLERGKMVKQFEDAAFSLKAGEVSNIIKSPYGLHIIKVHKVIPGNTLPYEDVKAKIMRKLGAKLKQEMYEKWMNDLRQAAFIEKSLFDDSVDEPTQISESDTKDQFDFNSIEKEFILFRNLRNGKSISEAEYRKRKAALLDKL